MRALGAQEGRNSDALFPGKVQFSLDSFIVGLSPEEGLVTSPVGLRAPGTTASEISSRRKAMASLLQEGRTSPAPFPSADFLIYDKGNYDIFMTGLTNPRRASLCSLAVARE